MIARRVLLVGHGAREAALAVSLARSGQLIGLVKLRNPLIAQLSSQLILTPSYEPQRVVDCALSTKPDFVMIGPEAPIAAGATDELEKAGFSVCAPSRQAARIEADKIYMRHFLATHFPALNVKYAVARTSGDIEAFFKDQEWPVAVKPNGLAGGKGVRVESVQLQSTDETISYALECLEKTREPILLEERMDGIEFTLHCVTDGQHTAFFPATYDYSYREEFDTGPQTGGMGSYCDSTPNLPFMTKHEYEAATDAMLRILHTMQAQSVSYKGVFQGQFFLTAAGLKVCEFACRFGDPEAVNLLACLRCSWLDVMEAVRGSEIRDGYVDSRPESSVVLCLVPPGYPSSSDTPANFTVDEEILARHSVKFLPAACERADSIYRAFDSRAVALLSTAESIGLARTAIERAVSAVKGLAYRADVATEGDIGDKIQRAREMRIKHSSSR